MHETVIRIMHVRIPGPCLHILRFKFEDKRSHGSPVAKISCSP